jgi:hypothetical protein
MPRKLKVTELEELGCLPEMLERCVRGESYKSISEWLRNGRGYDISAPTVKKALGVTGDTRPRKGHRNNRGKRKLPIDAFREDIIKLRKGGLNVGQIRKHLKSRYKYNAGPELGEYIRGLGMTKPSMGYIGTSPVDYRIENGEI